MAHRSDRTGSDDSRDREWSRRAFLAGATGAAASMVFGVDISSAGIGKKGAGRGAARATGATSLASVVMTRDSHLVPARIVQRGLLRTYLDRVVSAVAGEQVAGDAWNRLLSQDDQILIKFNRSMATLLGTSNAMAETLVASLKAAGFDPARIVLLEVDPDVRARTKTREPDYRWQGKVVKFGASGEDSFRADVDWATAIVNVPFLKTHHRAGMTGCLKNLSHGLIRHPARFHGDGCGPSIAEVNATPDLRDRLKLNIVNGLRMNFFGGPDGTEDSIANWGLLLAGTDPVACDSIGFGQINKVRSERGMAPLLVGPTLPPQLLMAQDLEVGTANPERIKLQVPVG